MSEEDTTARSTSVSAELRAAVQFAIIQILANDDDHDDCKMSARAIFALAELTCLYAASLGSDLQAFCSHASRKTMTQADVLLAARKLPERLRCGLEEFCKEQQGGNNTAATTAAGKDQRKPVPIDLQKQSKKKSAQTLGESLSSSSSSSDEDIFMDPLSFKPTAAPANKKQASALRDGDVSDDSSDDIQVLGVGLKARLSSKLASRPKEDDSFSSDDDDQQACKKPFVAPPARRFRLQTNATTTSGNHERTKDLSNTSKDDDLVQPSSSRVQQILANNDDDSVLDEKENDEMEF